MPITYEDLVKISQEMQEEKNQWNRDLFSCFENADYDRGDKIVIGPLFSTKFKIPEWAKHRIAVSPFIPTNGYAVLVGDKKEKRVKWAFEDFAQPVLKNPASILNLSGIA